MLISPLEVISIDVVSLHVFMLYFSDGTFVKATAEELAACFPLLTRTKEPE